MIALSPAARFAVAALAWSLALFAMLRLAWIDLHVVGWLVFVQQRLALWYGATPTNAVVVDSSCSGADVIALCLAATLAYPVAWKRRLLGAAGGIAVILTLNTVRIGTLLSTSAQPALFNTLHIYVWPAILMLGTGAYVLAWIGWSGGRRPPVRFALASMGALGVYAATAPWTMTSGVVLRAGVWTANAADALLSGIGVTASASGNVLWTPRGAFQVTQECLLTPLVPVYLAGAIALPLTRRARIMSLALALPLFFALGILRVLVLALPPAIVSSPLIIAHGFYQFLAGAVLIAAASWWALTHAREPWRTSQAAGRGAIAMAAALAAGALAARIVAAWGAPGDIQGALALLPAYQFGLLAALWIALSPLARWTRLAAALAVLAALQWALRAPLEDAHAVLVRACAVAIPAALAWLLFRPRRDQNDGYRDFWREVGEEFPDLGGAASTDFYRANEIRLIVSAIPDLRGARILKTDLWDEARNTRIMQWAASQGADVVAIDISAPTVSLARRQFPGGGLAANLADVRHLPFRDASFDAIYSMGTIEHFDESEDAVREMARVLKPGGVLILGVPNRFDPFLRPVMVWALWCLGKYGYGFEKSYSRRGLRRMVERAGLDVAAETGILFIPGWLRMADLFAHTRAPWLTPLTRAAVAVFSALDRKFAAVRRHGYLRVAVASRSL